MIAEAPDALDKRLKRIEDQLDFISSGLQQAPVLISIATDTVDEVLMHTKINGGDLEQNLKNGLQLLTRLSDPKMLEVLNNLLDLLEQSPGLVSIGIDSLDTMMKDNKETIADGISLVQDLASSLHDAKISDPIPIKGPLSILRLSRDRDVQKALGFLFNILKKLGQKI